jgi:hypothetical protein
MATSKRRAALDAWLTRVEELLQDPEGELPEDLGDDPPFEQGDAA